MVHPATPPQAPEGYTLKKKKKPIYKRVWFIILAVLVLFAIIKAASGSGEDTASTASPATSQAVESVTPAPASSTAPEPAPAPAPDAGTKSQKSAKDKAEQYLDIIGGFSHDGLIRQLTTADGFSTEDATWAVDHLNVDWNAQAADKAKQYQDTIGGFSRSSMIRQLTTADDFTQEQAEHGADSLGL